MDQPGSVTGGSPHAGIGVKRTNGRSARSAEGDDSRCLAVMYHYVHDGDPMPRRRWLGRTSGIRGLTCEQFADQVDYLCRTMEPIDWPTLYAWTRGPGRIPRRCFLLTFDDGLADHARNVLPILEDRGIRGVFFVPGMVLDQHRLLPAHVIHLLLSMLSEERFEHEIYSFAAGRGFDVEEALSVDQETAKAMYHYESPVRARLKYLLTVTLPIELRNAAFDAIFERYIGSGARWARHWYLGWDDAVEMQSLGHTIGGHGYSHEPLGRLTAAQRRIDLQKAANVLRSGLGPDIRPFSYPYGRFDEETCAACGQAGFAHAFTTVSEWITPGSDVLQLPRVDTIDANRILTRDEVTCTATL